MGHDLYYFEYVEQPASAIAEALEGSHQTVFRRATENAIRETERFRDRLHVDFAGLEVGRDVVLKVGTARDDGGSIDIPISWEAADGAGLFPAMEANLQLTQLADKPPLTQLAIVGEYRPPMGVVGAVGNAVIGHRLAEASVRYFIVDLANRLAKIDK